MSRADEIEDLPDIDGDCPPRLTREIIGHDTAFDAFTQARSQGRLHHSWLLSGIKGIGKASFAYQLSRHLLHDTPVDTPVQNVIEGDSPAVQLIESGTHPDLFVLSRSYNRDTDKFRTDIPIDDVRRMKSFFQLTSVGRNWRICIIDSLDEMNRYSLNSLLKILEEPPEKSIFLLVSHRVGGVLDTIRSRSRQLDFKPLTLSHLEHLITNQRTSIAPEEAAAAAFLADGSTQTALTLAELGGFDLYREMVSLLDGLPRPDIEILHRFADRFGPRGDPKSFQVFSLLLSNWVHRAVRGRIDGTGFVPVFAGEDAVAVRLTERAAIEPMLGLWEKIGHETRLAEQLNLDKKQIVLDWFADMGDLLA
ncbi:MAG: DNA polymerase III subunit tau [Rhodobiaceae bacterium UBA7378]|nr:MAG: DNA polymerase III subunit tau [Rhodobiaceae bacterium UBA7378]